MKRTLALLTALALLGACSSATEDDAYTPPVADAGEEPSQPNGIEPEARAPKTGSKASRPKGRKDSPKKVARPNGVAPSEEATPTLDAEEGPATPAPRPGGGRKGTRSPQGGGRAPDGTAAPEAGRFTYAQSGWEEFCAGPCNRQQLPATQDTDQKVRDAGAGRLEVVTTVRSGNNRSVRSTSVLSRSSLDITKVELTYGSFSETYAPAPPVRSLRFPLRVGDAWSGSWKANTSGDYRFQVLSEETLVVDGRRIKTFKLDTRTNFKGDFRGYANAVTWIDPRTATPIRTSGKIRLTTDFGRFNSNFDQMLLEGPGY